MADAAGRYVFWETREPGLIGITVDDVMGWLSGQGYSPHVTGPRQVVGGSYQTEFSTNEPIRPACLAHLNRRGGAGVVSKEDAPALAHH